MWDDTYPPMISVFSSTIFSCSNDTLHIIERKKDVWLVFIPLESIKNMQSSRK